MAVRRRWVDLEGTGGWNFMSYCHNYGFIDDTACNQSYTKVGKTITGTQLAVSPSYQMTYGSVAFQSSGTWRGLTFQRQLARMLEVSNAVRPAGGKEGEALKTLPWG